MENLIQLTKNQFQRFFSQSLMEVAYFGSIKSYLNLFSFEAQIEQQIHLDLYIFSLNFIWDIPFLQDFSALYHFKPSGCVSKSADIFKYSSSSKKINCK
jgi:hypothetical protein